MYHQHHQHMFDPPNSSPRRSTRACGLDLRRIKKTHRFGSANMVTTPKSKSQCNLGTKEICMGNRAFRKPNKSVHQFGNLNGDPAGLASSNKLHAFFARIGGGLYRWHALNLATFTLNSGERLPPNAW